MRTISIPPYAQEIIDQLENAGYEAYAVGGCVRDALLGVMAKDWDLCTNATPKQSLKLLKDYHCIKTGLQHGTITVMVQGEPIELTTYRLEGNYSDKRHPDEVRYIDKLDEDLSRRDFTINAMAYSPSKGLIDLFGGQQDLENKLIRCVGEASLRFEEDGLRILRALRFASRLKFELAPSTAEALRKGKALLDHISVERILKELRGILTGQAAASILLSYPEVFAQIMPELAPMQDFDQHSPHHVYDVWEHCCHTVDRIAPEDNLRLAALLHDCGKPATFSLDETNKGHFIGHVEESADIAHKLLRRLKSDNATIKAVCTLITYHDASFPQSKAGMRRWIGKLGAEGVEELMQLKRADVAAQSTFQRAEKLERIQEAKELLQEVLALSDCYTIKDLLIDGRDLIALGVPAGPEIKRILEALLIEVQEERLPNEFEPLVAHFHRIKG